MPEIDYAKVLKALADGTRLRIIKALFEKDHGVNELSDRLHVSQYNVSKHLRVLKMAHIVEMRPIGTRRMYFIEPGFCKQHENEGPVLDFGCCSLRFDRLAVQVDPSVSAGNMLHQHSESFSERS